MKKVTSLYRFHRYLKDTRSNTNWLKFWQDRWNRYIPLNIQTNQVHSRRNRKSK